MASQGIQSIQLRDQQQAKVDALKGSIAADEASMHTARLNLAYANIRAPFDGRTGTRLVDIGNLVQASQATASGQHHPDQADLRQLHRAAGRQ